MSAFPSHEPLSTGGPPPAPAPSGNATSSESKRESKPIGFEQAQSSVGWFKDGDQVPSTLHMKGMSPEIKITAVVAKSIAPECNFGVFHPKESAPRGKGG